MVGTIDWEIRVTWGWNTGESGCGKALRDVSQTLLMLDWDSQQD